MKTLKDGSKLFSPSESIPKKMDGYRPDKSNPRLWVPEMEPCVHRETTVFQKPCGDNKVAYHCALHGTQVTPGHCGECDDLKNPEDLVNTNNTGSIG